MKKSEMPEVVQKPIEEVVPYDNNPRFNDDAVDAVAASIKEFGFQQPIVTDKDGVIIVGHTRLKAAKKLGLKTVPVIVAELSKDKANAYRLADNKTGELATWDFSKLEFELGNIEIDMTQFGFEMDEIDGEPEFDVVEDDEPTEVETRCKPGDLWMLGNHRLVCGDSTNADIYAELMDGDLADLYLTDPPYNVNYTDGHESERKIMNDNFETDEQCGEELWLPAFTNARNHSNDKCSVYCFMPQGGTHMMMMMMMMKAGWQVKHELIWRKQSIVLNRADYNYQHEPILYGWNKTHVFYGNGEFKNTSVWEFDRPTRSVEHPTMKPVALLCEILLNATKEKDAVLDTFGGSGSTLIACEQLNRKCYMIELDPHYCDVILQRWENFTGRKAVRVNG